MSDHEGISAGMRRQLRNPVLAALGILLYGGGAVLLALYLFRPELRPAVGPWIGPGMAIVLFGYLVLLATLARGRGREDGPRR